jgi:hypothetical protein
MARGDVVVRGTPVPSDDHKLVLTGDRKLLLTDDHKLVLYACTRLYQSKLCLLR